MNPNQLIQKFFDGENTMTQLENLPNTGKALVTSGVGPLSRLLIVFIAAAVSLALPAIALAQRSAKPGQPTEGSSKTRVAKINMNKKENTLNQPSTATQLKSARSTAADAIRPFPKTHVPQEAIDKLRRRIADTQWPEKETVADSSQGVPLATMQELARYWATDYDWRKAEAKLNALPQFITTIDGLDIHFIHVRSREKNALPLVINHGWPGSVLEQIKLIGPLTDPVAHGGKVEDAFDVVIPSMIRQGWQTWPRVRHENVLSLPPGYQRSRLCLHSVLTMTRRAHRNGRNDGRTTQIQN
jgi:hypothetical protein